VEKLHRLFGIFCLGALSFLPHLYTYTTFFTLEGFTGIYDIYNSIILYIPTIIPLRCI
jgi:hypothetical protein